MKEAFALAATLVFMATGTVVGVRLLLLARRTRKTAELWLGLFVFSIAGLAYPLIIAGGGWATDEKRALSALGWALICFGWSCLWVFTWTTFRRETAWVLHLTILAIAASCAFTTWRISRILLGEASSLDAPSVDGLATELLALGLYVWTSAESFRYYAMLRRRVRLGLADPTVANRFLLWGLMGLFSFVSLVVPVAQDFYRTPDSLALARVVTGAAGTVCSLILYLAFMPPRSYLDWVRGRAAAPA